MTRKISITLSALLGLLVLPATGCVSAARYAELEDNYEEQRQVNRDMELEQERILQENARLKHEQELLEAQNATLASGRGGQDDGEVSRMLNEALERLASAFETSTVSSGDYYPEVERQGNRVVFRFSGDVSFQLGKADLTEAAKQALRTVAGELKSNNETIRIDGHTDNIPVKNPTTVAAFKDNLGLSAARARAVYDFLVANGVAAKRCYFAGFGEHFPRASNATDQGRLQNRRVEVFVGSRAALGLPIR